jgi:hypothetical protein
VAPGEKILSRYTTIWEKSSCALEDFYSDKRQQFLKNAVLWDINSSQPVSVAIYGYGFS